MLLQLLQHVAVAHVGADQRHVEFGQRELQAVVAHQGADHRPLQHSLRMPAACQHIEDVVAIGQYAMPVDQLHAIAIAVERDADVGAVRQHRLLQGLRMGRADFAVDVEAVRLVADGDHFGAQFRKHFRRHLVGRAMRAIQHQLEPVQAEILCHGALAVLRVTRHRIVDPARPAESLGRHRDELGVDLPLDRQLDLVGQFLAVGGEELDAVVVMRVMRGADHDAGLRAHGAGQVGHRRRRHRAEQAHVGTGGHQASLQRSLEHVARNAGDLADQHIRPLPAVAREHAAGGATQPQHEVRADRPLPDQAANAIRTEIFALGHRVRHSERFLPSLPLLRPADQSSSGQRGALDFSSRRGTVSSACTACHTANASTVAATSCTRTMRAPR